MTNPLTVDGLPIRYDLCPVDYMAEGLKRYLEQRIRCGDFMHSVLCGDLFGAFAHADDLNAEHLYRWCAWLYQYAPSGSFGSRENVERWLVMKP